MKLLIKFFIVAMLTLLLSGCENVVLQARLPASQLNYVSNQNSGGQIQYDEKYIYIVDNENLYKIDDNDCKLIIQGARRCFLVEQAYLYYMNLENQTMKLNLETYENSLVTEAYVFEMIVHHERLVYVASLQDSEKKVYVTSNDNTSPVEIACDIQVDFISGDGNNLYLVDTLGVIYIFVDDETLQTLGQCYGIRELYPINDGFLLVPSNTEIWYMDSEFFDYVVVEEHTEVLQNSITYISSGYIVYSHLGSGRLSVAAGSSPASVLYCVTEKRIEKMFTLLEPLYFSGNAIIGYSRKNNQWEAIMLAEEGAEQIKNVILLLNK